MKKKWLIWSLVILLICLMLPVSVSAETITQDGLEVSITTKTGNYSENDEIPVDIVVKNFNNIAVENITVESILPEGLKLNEKYNGSTAQVSLGANEEMRLSIVVGSSVAGSDTKNAVTPSASTVAKTQKTSNNPFTGEKGQLLIVLFVVFALFIAAILIKKSKKKKETINKVFSIFLCLLIFGSTISPNITKALAENEDSSLSNISTQDDVTTQSSITTQHKVALGETFYYIGAKVTYDSITGTPSGGDNISRIEWVTNLVTTLGCEIDIPDDELLYSFSDILDVATAKILNTAVIYGILPYDASAGIPNFNPNSEASREFAAMTAVKGLGFADSESVLDCTDANTLIYPNQDAIAVSIGLIQLQNKAFNPNGSLDQNEMSELLEMIKSINSPPEIDENYNNVVTYADGVKNLQSVTNYTATDGNTVVTVPVNDETKSLKVNDVFVLPGTDEHPSGISMKIIEISQERDVFVLTCIKPENMSDIVKDIDVEGYGVADIDNITVAEGVEYSYIEDEDADLPLSTLGNINGGGTVAIPGKLAFKIKKDIIPDKVNLEGTVKVSIPAIKYKVNADFGFTGNRINDLYLAIEQKDEVEGAVKLTAVSGELKKDGSIQLGRVGVPLGDTGLSVDIVLWVGFSLEGKTSVTYTIEQTNGIQVINNNLRMIKEAKISREVKLFEASFKLGPKLSATLTFFEAMDLADFTVDGGLGIKAGIIIRPTGLVCVDGTVYFYLETSAGKNSVLGQVFGLTYENEIYDETNSPYKLKLHAENGTPVPKCTYGKGTLSGSVAMASNRTNFIPNARVAVYSGNNLVKNLYSDSSGKYSAQLDDGPYTITVSANGYIPFDCDTVLKTNETTFVETLLMVAGDPRQQGIAGGIITDSVSGGTVADVDLTVRKGWNKTSGAIIQTGQSDISGNYRLSLPLGNYTIEMKKAGYTTGYLNIIAQGTETLNQNAPLTPGSSTVVSGDLRAVLTWGQTPSDLDSHLLGPIAGTEDRFHIYYGNKTYNQNGILSAYLDLDDTSSYGPETTTIYSINDSGVYSFYVHDYSNRGSYSSNVMSNSGAQVKLYAGDALIATYNIPTDVTGTVWHVFNYDASTKRLIPINDMSNTIQSNNTGITEAGLTQDDISTILNNLEDK